MTGRERVRAAIERTPLDHVPIYCDELFVNTRARWIEQGMPADRSEQEDFFGWDVTELFVDTSMRFEERLLEETQDQIKVADKYGFIATRNKHIPGIEYHEHPIKTREDWDRFKDRWSVSEDEPSRVHEVSYFIPLIEWPSWDEAAAIFERKRATGRHVTLRAYGHWEVLWRIHGFAESLMDLALNPKWLQDVFACYTAFLLDVLSTAFRKGIRVDSFFMLDDHGSNIGLLFSPETARNLILPHYRKIAGFLRSNGIYFFMHSCGDVRPLISDYADAGVQALNPLQATAMDVVDLKQLHGDKLTFFGNIDSRTMHDRSIVLPEIERKVTAAGKGGGYIFSSDHSIPERVDLATYLEILQLVRSIPQNR